MISPAPVPPDDFRHLARIAAREALRVYERYGEPLSPEHTEMFAKEIEFAVHSAFKVSKHKQEAFENRLTFTDRIRIAIERIMRPFG